MFPTHPLDLEFAEAIVHAEQQPGDRFLLRAELSTTIIPQTVYENRKNEELCLAVYEQSVASAFHGYFTDLWDALPPRA